MRLNTKFHYLIWTFMLVFLTATAQVVTVSPVPQSVVWGAKSFDNMVTFQLQGQATADQDAIALLNKKLTIGTTGIQLIVGQRGDGVVTAYESEIPKVKEGYYLKVESDKVIVAGHDSIGTYYAVQSLLQILKSPEVMSVTIKDYPDVIDRGVIEGFYGNPFSQADRISQFRFYGENKMNVYIYGPKDDPYHGFSNRWRDAYPAADAVRIKALIEEAHRNKVNFVWAVHPGNDIKWVDNNGDGVIDDFKAAVNKFELMYALGVRAFAVFFDDIGGVGTDPANQAKMLNYLTDEFVNKKSDVAPLILCPTQYNQAYAGGDYLSILGTQMDKSVRIMWTGKGVVRMIDKETMDWINAKIKRNAYIWLNYPVTDYISDRMLMGPMSGNGTNIATQLSGFTANPMEYAEASKVGLYQIADYTWNMKKFNPQTSWLRGLEYLMPDNTAAFKVFCENNVDLGANFHGLRMPGESLPFKAASEPFMNSFKNGNATAAQSTAVTTQFQSFRDASAELIAANSNPALVAEITPWVKVFDIIAEKGLHLMDMYQALNDKDSVTFVKLYLKIDSLETVQKNIRSRDFPGSIKNPNPKAANEVVTPFIKQLKSMLVTSYRREFKYRLDVFPRILLEEGRYYIKVNGKYLTNVKSSGNPTLLTDRDIANPQRQEWNISMDPITERYKITNAYDSRYINELGSFGTNPYEAVWHTYNLSRLNGKYAIQNAGSAGDKFWVLDSNRINRGTKNALTIDEYIFEIIPIGDETSNHPIIKEAENYFIRNNDLYLTNNNTNGSGGNPTFKSLGTSKLKSQLWNVNIDTSTKRYKLTSAADKRYVSEKGVFGTNAYFPTWNTYNLTELGGSFAFQNAGEAGTKYWKIEDNRIYEGNESRENSYLFELIPEDVLFPTSLKKNFQPKNQVYLNGDQLVVDNKMIASIDLISQNGVLLKSVENINSMSVCGIPAGFYIVSITTLDGDTNRVKVLLN